MSGLGVYSYDLHLKNTLAIKEKQNTAALNQLKIKQETLKLEITARNTRQKIEENSEMEQRNHELNISKTNHAMIALKSLVKDRLQNSLTEIENRFRTYPSFKFLEHFSSELKIQSENNIKYLEKFEMINFYDGTQKTALLVNGYNDLYKSSVEKFKQNEPTSTLNKRLSASLMGGAIIIQMLNARKPKTK